MALMNLNKRESIMYLLIGLNNQTIYIKTKNYVNSKDLIVDVSNHGTLLKQVNSDLPREVAYAPGFFISAQEIDEQAVSQNYNKIWEII